MTNDNKNAPFLGIAHNIAYPSNSTEAMIFMNMNPSFFEHAILYGILNARNNPFAHGCHPCSHHAMHSCVFAVGWQSPFLPIATGHNGPSHPSIGTPNLHAAALTYRANGSTLSTVEIVRLFMICDVFCVLEPTCFYLTRVKQKKVFMVNDQDSLSVLVQARVRFVRAYFLGMFISPTKTRETTRFSNSEQFCDEIKTCSLSKNTRRT